MQKISEPITRVTGEMGAWRGESRKKRGGGGCHGDKAKRVRFYASGLVTNIRLNCCCARVRRAEGHLTSIAGGNRRLIQLNLFAISVRLAVCLAQPLPKLSKPKCDTCNLSLPNGRPGAVSAAVSRACVEVLKKQQPGGADKASGPPPNKITNYLKMQNKIVV